MFRNNRQGSNMINPNGNPQQEHKIINLPIVTNTPQLLHRIPLTGTNIHKLPSQNIL